MSAPSSDSAGIRQVIRTLKADKWELDSVWDGEESIPVTTETAAVDGVMAVDMAHIYFKRDGEQGWVYFVLGNEPDEVVNDYTTNLDPALTTLTNSWY